MISYEDYLEQEIDLNEHKCSYSDHCDAYNDSHSDSYWTVPLIEPKQESDSY